MPMKKGRVLQLIYDTLLDVQERQGLPPYRLCDLVARRVPEGVTPPSRVMVVAALQRGLEDGSLVYSNRRYNVNTDSARCRRPRKRSTSKDPKKRCKSIVTRIRKYFKKMMKPCKTKSSRKTTSAKSRKCARKARKVVKRPKCRC